MDDQAQRQLEPLAQKLGTSVEHLWSVLIRQAYIDGLSSLATILVCIAVAVTAILLYRRWKPKPDFLPNPTPQMILAMILLGCTAVAGSNIYWVISDFWNPEFYAYRQLPFVR